MTGHSLARIALHASPRDVIGDAVATARRLTGADSAFAAVASESGGYQMTALETLSDPRWAQMRILPGRGLGGKALAESRPCYTSDYFEDSSITGDYRVVVCAEGLHMLSCVPVLGAGGIAALLYLGGHRIGAPGDRQFDLMLRLADLVEVGLTLAARRASGLTATGPLGTLTPREREVLALLCEGSSNRAIATGLGLAESTVKGHVRALIEKYGASSRLDVVARARQASLDQRAPAVECNTSLLAPHQYLWRG
jgi:DNA-binding CsgD family transcriptional regulator